MTDETNVKSPEDPAVALPVPPAPRGEYVPAVVMNGVAYSAGMTPRVAGDLYVRGAVGDEVSLEVARDAAGIAAANALAAIAAAAGGLGRIARLLRVTVYLACKADFIDHSAVADGASAELKRHLGEGAVAARTAIGVRCLPSGSPVEVELIAALRP